MKMGMRLATVITTSREKNKMPRKSKVLVDMDKFANAMELSTGDVNMFFVGPFCLNVEREDFLDLMRSLGAKDEGMMPRYEI